MPKPWEEKGGTKKNGRPERGRGKEKKTGCAACETQMRQSLGFARRSLAAPRTIPRWVTSNTITIKYLFINKHEAAATKETTQFAVRWQARAQSARARILSSLHVSHAKRNSLGLSGRNANAVMDGKKPGATPLESLLGFVGVQAKRSRQKNKQQRSRSRGFASAPREKSRYMIPSHPAALHPPSSVLRALFSPTLSDTS